MTKPGHNSGSVPEGTKELVERIERLETEKADIVSDIKDVYTEAKSKGHDVKVLKEAIRRRRKDNEAEREKFETSVDLYIAFLLS